MRGAELETVRVSLGYSLAEFGVFVAELLQNERPYTRQDVNKWEKETHGRKPPAKVEAVLLREGLWKPAKKTRRA